MTDFDPRRRLDDDHIANQTHRMTTWLDRPKPTGAGPADFNLRGGTNDFGVAVIFFGALYALIAAIITIIAFFAKNWSLLVGGGFLIVHLLVAIVLDRVFPRYFATNLRLLVTAVCSGIFWFLFAVTYDWAKNGVPIGTHFDFTLPSQDPFGPFIFLSFFLLFVAVFSLFPYARSRMTALRATVFAHVLGIVSYVSLVAIIIVSAVLIK